MNHTDYSEIIKAQIAAIRGAIEQAISKAAYDKTFKAVVLGKTAGGKYLVQYRNCRYTAFSSAELKENSVVYVCAPQNNWSELFVIAPADGWNLK